MNEITDPSSEGVWQADPFGRFEYRWWDGSSWTDRVSATDGSTVVDPLGTQAAPPLPVVDASESGSSGSSPDAVWPAPPPPSPSAPVQHTYAPAPLQQPVYGMQTPNFNMPGGGPWAAPQQIVVSNASKSPGLAISSLVLGVGAFFVSLIPVIGFSSIPFAIVGLALGIAGIFRANKGFEGRGLSIAGVASSIAALLVSIVYIFAIGAAVDDVPDVNSDPSNGLCDESRYFQDPDC